jgi:hypothetical protein
MGVATVNSVTGTTYCEDSSHAAHASDDFTGGTTNVDQYDTVQFEVNNTPGPGTDDYIICLNYRVVVQ